MNRRKIGDSGLEVSTLDDANRKLLELMSDPLRKDAGTLTNFVTYSQRLKDKLENYYRVQRTAPRGDPATP